MGKDASQKERMPAALHPGYFKVDDRSLQDLCEEARALAEALVFYESPAKKPAASWAAFFDEAAPYLQKISSEDCNLVPAPHQAGQCPPHLGLFLAFLKLFGHTQQELNALTTSHLRFFYDKILGQAKKKARPDKVYVFFDLARNIEKHLLHRGTVLSAGKDRQGKEITYATDRELVLHKTRVTRFMAIRNQKDSDGAMYAFPVADSSDGYGNPLKEGQGWYPFGDPGDPTGTVPSSPEIGWAIGSPMLLLKEGRRTIEITFLLTGNHPPGALPDAPGPSWFEARFTGPDQWFAKKITEVRYQDGKLTFVTQLNEVDPPVAPFDQNIHGYQIGQTGRPLVKIVFRQGFSYSRYNFVQSLEFTAITLRVNVEKARSLLIRNDFGDLDAQRAFQPFGYSPVKGANLYLGLEETFLKPVSRFVVHINWKGLPEDFKAYYEGYLGATNSLVSAGEDFRVRAAIHHQRDWSEIKNETQHTEDFPLFSDELELIWEPPRGATPACRDITHENGLIRLTLSDPGNAFGHLMYPAVYAKVIMAQLQNKESPIPNEPYTPGIESVALDYTAEQETSPDNINASPLHYYYAGPFGIKEKPLSSVPCPLLSGEFRHAGSLYLGMENLRPPQQLTLFFEIAEETPQDKPDPAFFYLGNDGWHPLPGHQVLSDTTLGLKQTGILLLNLPAGMTNESPLMPGNYHWLRISVPGFPERFGSILSIGTNAVSCSLASRHAGEHFDINSLPPFSIKRFVEKIRDVKKIQQPYSSFGGRRDENERDYFTRVSEKLRHKGRSITCWDIERLILEQFPEIYKVKCIPPGQTDGAGGPGSIHIIVIPVIKQRSKQKVLRPMVSNSTLVRIKAYIESRSSAHTRLTVVNPHFEEIKVVAAVSFTLQVDAGFYLKKLQRDLQYFLSPWAFQDDIEIQLGSKLYRSSVIAFIESRPYINFIARIKLLKNNEVVEDNEVRSDAQTTLVSADVHDIEAIGPDSIACQTNQGIDQMIVDINFEVQ